jgi:predicted transcriptional regulator
MNITRAESTVMDVLWRLGPTDAEAIVQELAGTVGWNTATVRTLLERLAKKKFVARRKGEGPRITFAPLAPRDDYVFAESKDLVDRLFRGRFGPLAAQFAERETLTEEDVAELKAIIARIEDGR